MITKSSNEGSTIKKSSRQNVENNIDNIIALIQGLSRRNLNVQQTRQIFHIMAQLSGFNIQWINCAHCSLYIYVYKHIEKPRIF